jgi:2-C-methyl-D-erythritol 2,4-cyclodiphosphate synthase
MQFKDISSLRLLEAVRDRLHEEGYTLENADITVIAQKPKLSPYIDEMRAVLATTLRTDIKNISVKATTTEKMGFTGRGEGISAHAVVLLKE